MAQEPGLMIPNSIVHINQKGVVPITHVNNTNKSFRLLEVNVIATISIIEEHEISALSKCDADIRTTDNTDNTTDNKINDLDTLLGKHNDLCAKTVSDLGKTPLIEMTIDTQGHQPTGLQGVSWVKIVFIVYAV